MVIWFNSYKARRQLINKGYVVTARKFRKTYGIQKALYRDKSGNIQTIGKVDIKLIDDSMADAQYRHKLFHTYIQDSGFESVKEWGNEVMRLNKPKCDMPLYLLFLGVELL